MKLKQFKKIILSLFTGYSVIIITYLITSWITQFEDIGFFKDLLSTRIVIIAGFITSLIFYMTAGQELLGGAD